MSAIVQSAKRKSLIKLSEEKIFCLFLDVFETFSRTKFGINLITQLEIVSEQIRVSETK